MESVRDLYYKEFTSTQQTRNIFLVVFERLEAHLKVPLKEHDSFVRYNTASLFKKRKAAMQHLNVLLDSSQRKGL